MARSQAGYGSSTWLAGSRAPHAPGTADVKGESDGTNRHNPGAFLRQPLTLRLVAPADPSHPRSPPFWLRGAFCAALLASVSQLYR